MDKDNIEGLILIAIGVSMIYWGEGLWSIF